MFRRLSCLLVLTTVCLSASAIDRIPFSELLFKGRAQPFYGSANSNLQNQILNVAKGSNLMERMSQVVNDTLRVKNDFGIGLEACGNPNAFFDRRRQAIVICLELIELMIKEAKSDSEYAQKLDQRGRKDLIDGAIWGIFFHELAHALIAINNINVPAREEDLADIFAVWYAVNLVEPKGVSVIQPTIWFFQALAKSQFISSADQDQIKRLMADEHSLSEQRIYNLACWAYGANSARGAAAANMVSLPRARGDRCPEEYARIDKGVRNNFLRFLKPQR